MNRLRVNTTVVEFEQQKPQREIQDLQGKSKHSRKQLIPAFGSEVRLLL